MSFYVTHDCAPLAVRAPRRLPVGVGLALGAAVSLGLWAALGYAVVRLIG